MFWVMCAFNLRYLFSCLPCITVFGESFVYNTYNILQTNILKLHLFYNIELFECCVIMSWWLSSFVLWWWHRCLVFMRSLKSVSALHSSGSVYVSYFSSIPELIWIVAYMPRIVSQCDDWCLWLYSILLLYECVACSFVCLFIIQSGNICTALRNLGLGRHKPQAAFSVWLCVRDLL